MVNFGSTFVSWCMVK